MENEAQDKATPEKPGPSPVRVIGQLLAAVVAGFVVANLASWLYAQLCALGLGIAAGELAANANAAFFAKVVRVAAFFLATVCVLLLLMKRKP